MTDRTKPTDVANLRVFVTGASGFIGSHVVRRLLADGAEVHAFVRRASSFAGLEDCVSQISTHRGDLTEYSSLLTAFRNASPHVVFHLAGDSTARRSEGGWEGIERSIAVNLTGTIKLVRAATESKAPIRNVVRVGGLEEYGTADLPFTEGARELPVSAYSASQVAATHFCQAVQPQLSYSVVTMRPALVYGPGQSSRFFIPQLIESCLSGIDFDMTAGTQSRDLVYIDDVVDGLLLAGSSSEVRGEVFNLATGEEHTLSVVADHILRLTGASIKLRRGARPTSYGDLEHLVGSTDHAARTLGWRYRTGLADGLARTVDWYKARQ